MLEMLREGDTVVVWKLDRLGRSVQNLVALVNRFNDMGVQFRSLTEQIDTTTPGGCSSSTCSARWRSSNAT